jgi:hypothetical protein
VKDGIELVGQARLKVVAEPFGLRAVDNANGPL